MAVYTWGLNKNGQVHLGSVTKSSPIPAVVGAGEYPSRMSLSAFAYIIRAVFYSHWFLPSSLWATFPTTELMKALHCWPAAGNAKKHPFLSASSALCSYCKFASLLPVNPFILTSMQWVFSRNIFSDLLITHGCYPLPRKLISALDITAGDEKKVGYYAGLIVGHLSLIEFLFLRPRSWISIFHDRSAYCSAME